MMKSKKYTTTKLPACLANVESPEDAAIRILRAQLAAAEVRAEETRRMYDELLYQVSMRHPGESRHQTALRYLRQSESNVCGPANAALAEGEAG